MDSLAIIILNYNTYKMTINLISQLIGICDKAITIIVVDNKSTNESLKEIRKYYEQTGGFVLLESTTNGGYASGNNVGLRYAQEKGLKYSLIINNDIEIKDISSIKKMIKLIESNDSIGVVSPIIQNIDGTISPPKYPYKPSFWDLTFNVFGFQKARYTLNEYENVKVYAPRGSCMLVNNKYMKLVSNFDEKTFLYYEEPILAEKLLNIGKQCWHCGEASVIHNHAKTISTNIKKKEIANILCESYKYYLRKYRKMKTIQIKLCVLIRRIAVMR